MRRWLAKSTSPAVSSTAALVRGLERLAASGMRQLDVARIYGEGMAGRALAASPPALAAATVVNTKASVRDDREDTILTHDGVLRQMELSLAALGRSSVNVYFLHQPDARTVLDDALRAVDRLHREGKLQEFGLSNFPAWQVTQIFYKCRAEGWVLPTVFQGHYNALHRELEAELIPCLRMLGMRLQCFSPLAAGHTSIVAAFVSGMYMVTVRSSSPCPGCSDGFSNSPVCFTAPPFREK